MRNYIKYHRRIFASITICISISACDYDREHNFINALNNHNIDELLQIEHFEYNNNIYSSKDIMRMAQYDEMVNVRYKIDSVKVMKDSSLLYTHWSNTVLMKYNIPKQPTNILLKFRKNVIYEARFMDMDSLNTDTYNQHYEKYLLWLESNYPELYFKLEQIGTDALDNDSLFIEFTRVLLLKFDEYDPD